MIFNVSDDLVEDLYEVIEAEDADIEKGKLQSAIQRIGMVLLWLPNKALNRYWARKHVIILPSWAFNKLILGNISIWFSIILKILSYYQISTLMSVKCKLFKNSF